MPLQVTPEDELVELDDVELVEIVELVDVELVVAVPVLPVTAVEVDVLPPVPLPSTTTLPPQAIEAKTSPATPRRTSPVRIGQTTPRSGTLGGSVTHRDIARAAAQVFTLP